MNWKPVLGSYSDLGDQFNLVKNQSSTMERQRSFEDASIYRVHLLCINTSPECEIFEIWLLWVEISRKRLDKNYSFFTIFFHELTEIRGGASSLGDADQEINCRRPNITPRTSIGNISSISVLIQPFPRSVYARNQWKQQKCAELCYSVYSNATRPRAQVPQWAIQCLFLFGDISGFYDF